MYNIEKIDIHHGFIPFCNNILYYYCIIGIICILLLCDIHTFFLDRELTFNIFY